MPDDFCDWYARWRRRELTVKDMEAHCGMHISTIYRKARELGLPFESMKIKGYPYKRTEAKKTPS